ncbi:MAG: TRAP transporter small permease [Alphaproteobacteria bacterium]|nr:TRAP transporter small permease [Alphaproteobacteria bacterium]
MKMLQKWFTRGAEFIAAAMLAAMFITFLLQIFSRYVLLTPFGWTLELCLILWVWIVFFGCAFIVRERDHVTFDILYLAAPRRVRQVLALIACAAIVIGIGWAFLPTWDYIDWMKIRKTATVRNPFTGDKIPMRTIFSVYGLFMVALILRYAWRFIDVLRNGPPDEDHEIPGHEPEPPAIRHGDDVV